MLESFEFEAVDACMLCGSREQHDAQGVSMRGVAFSYCYCARCGLKYMRPRPTAACYERFYKEAYWTEIVEGRTYPTIAAADDPRVDQRALRLPKFKTAYEHVSRDMLRHRGLDAQTRVLEVGCGFGYTLEWLARDYGCPVFGIEPGAEALRRCAEAPAISIVARTAEEYLRDVVEPNADGRFDVILFRHCLENMVDPRRVLQGTRARLNDGGLLLIYTPNVEFYDIMNPYHPYIYSPETISRLVQMCGFEVVKVRASASPLDHASAVDIVNPSYEIGLFAKRGNPSPVVVPQVDPHRLVMCHKLGRDATAWSKLSSADASRRVWLRLRARLVRTLGGKS